MDRIRFWAIQDWVSIRSTFDAVYFGALTANLDTVTIPANLFVSSGWDLNTSGNYIVWTKAIGPGVQTQNVSITGITVLPVPEPATIGLLGLGAAGLVTVRRCKARRD
ncbi:PEP-CTERM sorting domain-containing protein [Lacipirellula limnantheis]|uniref:PEP-CTERM motif protein n=1 Tax=Lacipirellula limnantheis TaxID=2528024 RepID=A0A517TZM9_9BACT|nr:PEP-CTERM sorting domain-containing protein [Lacipirellula limnantheis]QDT73824.1 PEP-CTERM motif protein [Lacipirellula limnantheis]